jgi:anti-sigma factor ChrR (cupin superfamily)
MHRFSQQEMTETASLYALGALSQWEARAFEEHLAEGCRECAAELQSFEETTRALGLAAHEARPPASVKERLLSLVAEEDGHAHASNLHTAPSELLTLRADEGQWHEAGRGIRVKPLFTDPRTRMVTTLVRMEPGTRIPLHRHRGVEQCYVIEGDFHADNRQLGAGDFHVAHAGSVHEPVFTVEGALVLIIAHEGYEVLEPQHQR